MEADHFISTKTKSQKGGRDKRLRTKSMSNYLDILKERENKLSFDDRVQRQMTAFCRFFYPRRTVLRKAFLSHDNDGTGVLSKSRALLLLLVLLSVCRSVFLFFWCVSVQLLTPPCLCSFLFVHTHRQGRLAQERQQGQP
jgi:hypothetical protein